MKKVIKNTPREAHQSTKTVLVILGAIFFSMFLIGNVSSATWDNWKYYDEETKTITIRNNFILRVLERATLLSNTYNCASECKAEKEITLYDDGVLIEDLKFYRLFTNGSKGLSEPRRYNLKYYIDVGEEIYIPKETLSNGTIIKESKIIYNKKNFRWVNYEPGTEVKAGTYQVELTGTKKVNRIYDWQIQLQGRWIDEWSTWGNISLGDDSEVILASPDDNITSLIDDPISYNATANVTGGASLVNMSLYDDSSGTWKLNETVTFPAFNEFNEAHGKVFDDSGPTGTGKTGFQITMTSDGFLQSITKSGSTSATEGYVTETDKTVIAQATFSGNIATFSPSVQLNDTFDYWFLVDDGGSTFNSHTSGEISGYPVSSTHFDWIKAILWTGSESTLRWLNVQSVNISNSSADVTFSAQNFSKNVLRETTWNVQGCDSDNACGFAVANKTVRVVPVINVFSPTNTTFTTSTIFFNATNESSSVDAWIVNYNGTNVTLSDINTTLTVEDGTDFNLLLYANSTTGFFALNDTIFFSVDTTSPLISYISPTEVNNSNFTRNWVFVNVSITETNRDSTTFRIYNSTGEWNSTIYTTFQNTINWTGLEDGIYSYNATVNDSINNVNTTLIRTITLDNTNPSISYETPTTSSGNTTQTFIEVNVTASDTNLDSIIIYIYNSSSLVQSNISTISPLFVNLTGLPDETYTVNATANDTLNNLNSTSDRTITIDTIAPQITVTFPNETIDFHNINTNLFINWTVSDTSLDTCQYDWDGTNVTVTCLDNQTSLNITDGTNKNLTFYVNDTNGNLNSSSVSWRYKIFQNSLNYTLTSIGGSTEDFTLNITKDSSLQISTVDLVYNLSASSASFTSGDTSIVSKSLIVPNPSADSNFSFFFSFTFDDDSIVNISSNNQTVLNLDIGNCSTFSTLIYNFTLFDEENQTKLTNVTIDYAFNLFDDSGVTQIVNFSLASTANPTQICINQNLTVSSSYSLDAVLKYLSSDAVGYLTRFYNILNFSLTNSSIPNNIIIYDVIGDTATPFQLTFRDSSLVLAPNILVNVNKQFVDSNDFRTVEIPITDTNGQTILNLVRNIAIYNLIFIDSNRNIIASFSKISAFCDITIETCTLSLDATSTIAKTFNLSESTGISYTLEYTNSTSTVTLTFSSFNSTAVTARIVGTTQNQFGNKSVCDSSLTSTLGTVECDVSSILTTDNYLFIDIFSDGNFVETRAINIDPGRPLIGGLYGANGYFIAFLMLLMIIILFSEDKQVLLVMLGIGWVVILVFGLVKGAIIGSVSGGIWLLVSIFTMIWKLRQEEVGK